MPQCFVIEKDGFELSITESEVTSALLKQGGVVTNETVATYLKQKMDEYIQSKKPVDLSQEPEGFYTRKPVEQIQPGFTNYGLLSKKDEQIILKEAADQTKKQGYPVKKSVVYAHWGNMWAVTDKGMEAFPVFGQHLRKSTEKSGFGKNLYKIDLPKSNINHNDGGKGWYDYYPTDQNGGDLSDIPESVRSIIQNMTGIDMSVYDSAIINSYGETTELTRHIDNTEDKGFAYKIPIISISLIGDSKFQYSSPSNNPTNSLADDKSVALKPGQVVVFGNESRAMAHRVLNGKSGKSVSIKNTVSSLQTERINITLRRALPLTEEEYNNWLEKTKELKGQNTGNSTTNSREILDYKALNEVTSYSGAADGADKTWEQEGKSRGLKHVNYIVNTLSKLTPEQQREVENAYQQAVKDLGRRPLPYDWQNPNDVGADGKKLYYSGGLVRRDYLQAKAGDAVFGIIEGFDVSKGKSLPKGGTGYAVVMATALNKPVYLFDQSDSKWYDYNKGNPIEIETPVLTKKATLVGTRKIKQNGIDAIKAVFDKTAEFLKSNSREGLNENASESTQIPESEKDKAQEETDQALEDLTCN